MRNKRVVLLIVVLAFLAGILIFREVLFRPNQGLVLISTNPRGNQTNVSPSLEKISFEFSQNIEDLSFSFNVFPVFSFQFQAENNQLFIIPEEPLNGEENYLVEIREASSAFYFPLEFTTGLKINENHFLEEEGGLGDPEAEENLARAVFEDYPLFYLTPKITDSWQADYSQKKELTVFYQPSLGLEVVQAEVFAWMEEEGVDPETHSFKWQPISQNNN